MAEKQLGVSREEWAWITIASALLLLAASAPYLVGLLSSTPELQFGGFVFGLDDMHSYLAKMRFGARAGPFFELVYTHEPQDSGGLVFLFHQGLGWLTGLITGERALVSAGALIVAYHAARVVCGFLLLLVMYRFIASYLPERSLRRLAWALAALASGLDWTLLLFQGADLAPEPLALYVPEAFTFLSLMGLPHLLLARALLLSGWLAFFRSLEGQRVRCALLAGLAWLGMGLLVPFYVALLGILIAAWLGARWVIERRFPAQPLVAAILATLLPVVLLLYNTWLFTSNPIYAAWSAQNTLPSPPPGVYALAFGPLFLLALPGAVRLARAGLTRRATLLIAWPMIALLLVYAPINVQRRLLEGVIVPLAVLAAAGVSSLAGEQVRVRSLRGAGLTLMLVMLLPSTLLLDFGSVLAAAHPAAPIFLTPGELAALDYMRLTAPMDSVVLSTNDSGSLLPAYAGVRVYVGHGPETLNGAHKRETAMHFFGPEMTDSERAALLKDIHAAYVWVGPLERALCPGTCLNLDELGLRPVYNQGDYTIFKVGR